MAKAKYAILRFAKYKGPEISNIEAHNERTKEKYASNPDIDKCRSRLNSVSYTHLDVYKRQEYAYKLEIYYFFVLGAISNIIVRKNINHTGNRRTVKGRK